MKLIISLFVCLMAVSATAEYSEVPTDCAQELYENGLDAYLECISYQGGA